jgi:hypothetical protein
MRQVYFAALSAVLLAGCSTTASLYPVEGPLSKLVPIPIIVATVSGITGNNGPISMTMPDGSTCIGEWSSAAASPVSYGAGSLIGTYGATYFQGINLDAGRGQNPGRAIANCSDGNQVEVEFITGAGTATGFGVARDRRANVFRVLF